MSEAQRAQALHLRMNHAAPVAVLNSCTAWALHRACALQHVSGAGCLLPHSYVKACGRASYAINLAGHSEWLRRVCLVGMGLLAWDMGGCRGAFATQTRKTSHRHTTTDTRTRSEARGGDNVAPAQTRKACALRLTRHRTNNTRTRCMPPLRYHLSEPVLHTCVRCTLRPHICCTRATLLASRARSSCLCADISLTLALAVWKAERSLRSFLAVR